MKPNTTQAMQQLIEQIRQTLPLEASDIELCRDDCRFCSLKLIEFMRSELENEQSKLEQGIQPGLAELSRLAKIARKVQRALIKNGLIDQS